MGTEKQPDTDRTPTGQQPDTDPQAVYNQPGPGRPEPPETEAPKASTYETTVKEAEPVPGQLPISEVTVKETETETETDKPEGQTLGRTNE